MMRDNPLAWNDEEAEGVLSPGEGFEGSGTALDLLEMPDGARLQVARQLDAALIGSPAVFETLTRIEVALGGACDTGRSWRLRVDHLSKDDRAVLFDALGQGEVSVLLSGAAGEGDAQIVETILPGVWLGKAASPSGAFAEWVEVGKAPRALLEAAVVRPRGDLPIEALTPPRDAMNVMNVLAEVRGRARAYKTGEPNHVMNFTLFPMTPADSAFLAKSLGEVGVRISSGGYGAARVVMTALRNVWAVQFLNGLGSVILDTLEVGDVPDAVLAAPSDLEVSKMRLGSILEAYSQ